MSTDQSRSADGRFGPSRRPLDFAAAADRASGLDRADVPDRPGLETLESDDWRTVNRPAVESGELPGLVEAQMAVARDWNGETRTNSVYHLFDPDKDEAETPAGQEASTYTDEMVRRMLNGERSEMSPAEYDDHYMHMTGRERFFHAATAEDQSIMGDRNIEITLAFPERDLLPELERIGVTNVAVSPMTNGRETGLVYTVLTPHGDTRSFSLYQHRNTDSFIINGTTNWDTETARSGPRTGAGKDAFFAEYANSTPSRQIAGAMGFFLKGAQDGTLESDQVLADKAERLDWTAIISEQIPGYKEWVDESFPSKTADDPRQLGL